jgi:hypothetical protein
VTLSLLLLLHWILLWLLLTLLLLLLLPGHHLLRRQRVAAQQQVVGLDQQLRTAHAVLHTLPQHCPRIHTPYPWCCTCLSTPLLPAETQGFPKPLLEGLFHVLAPLSRLEQQHTEGLRALPAYRLPEAAVGL